MAAAKKSNTNSEDTLKNEAPILEDTSKDTAEYDAKLIAAQQQESTQHIEQFDVIQKEEIFGVLFPVFLQFEKSRIIKALNDSTSFSGELDRVNDQLIRTIKQLQSYWSDQTYQLEDQRFWLHLYLGFAGLRMGAIEVASLYNQSNQTIFDWLFEATRAEYKRVKGLI